MLARACTIFGLWALLIAAPAWGAGGRYDPDYPFCMEVVDTSGGRIECRYASYEQCRQFTFGAGGTCFKNPNYVPPPAGAAPSEAAPAETEPAPATKPAKSAGRYDPDYPVCMEVADTSGGRIDCSFTAMAQCQAATGNIAATCINNPAYVPPPPEPASSPAPPAPPAKAAKSKKSAKSAKSPPSPQTAPSR